jgi:hypothetical protein
MTLAPSRALVCFAANQFTRCTEPTSLCNQAKSSLANANENGVEGPHRNSSMQWRSWKFSALSHEETPFQDHDGACRQGVLGLRKKFVSRTSCCAQDDSTGLSHPCCAFCDRWDSAEIARLRTRSAPAGPPDGLRTPTRTVRPQGQWTARKMAS